jgi:hypothetical protein
MVELYLHSPNTHSWHGDKLKHRDNFTLPLLEIIQCVQYYSTTVPLPLLAIIQCVQYYNQSDVAKEKHQRSFNK